MTTGKKGRLERAAAALFTVVICFCLPGCWDEVNLQEVNYVSALGVDYKNGNYELYAKLINFASVAKTDSPQSNNKEVWIGRGSGKSVLLAFYDLSQASSNTLNLEHLKSVVLHKRAVNKISDVLDGLNRQRASRYTSLLFGTMEPLEELFTTENFFDQSPLNSILYQPEPNQEQFTFVSPLHMQSAVQMMREPGMTTALPVLNESSKFWMNGKKKINTQFINGVFVFKNFTFQGYIEEKDIRGIRWLSESFHRVLMEAGSKPNEATVAIVGASCNLYFDLNKETFKLNAKLEGHVVELDGKISETEIEASLNKRVKDEIEELYRFGAEKGMDFLDLEHHLYRYHHQYWKQNMAGKVWRPKPDRLEVDVKLNVTDSGKFNLYSGT